MKGSTRLTEGVRYSSFIPMSAWHSSWITHTNGVRLGNGIKDKTEETKARGRGKGVQ
jgi:hypothetical protein